MFVPSVFNSGCKELYGVCVIQHNAIYTWTFAYYRIIKCIRNSDIPVLNHVYPLHNFLVFLTNMFLLFVSVFTYLVHYIFH